MSIYRLWYKKLLSGMIEIRKPNIQQPLPREQGVMLVTRSGDFHISSSYVLKRMFTKGYPSLPHTMTSVPESSVLFCLKRDEGLMRDSTEESSHQTFSNTRLR